MVVKWLQGPCQPVWSPYSGYWHISVSSLARNRSGLVCILNFRWSLIVSAASQQLTSIKRLAYWFRYLEKAWNGHSLASFVLVMGTFFLSSFILKALEIYLSTMGGILGSPTAAQKYRFFSTNKSNGQRLVVPMEEPQAYLHICNKQWKRFLTS